MTVKHILITGEVQVGKSTLLRRFLSRHPDWKVGGFRTVTLWQDEVKGVGTVHLLPAVGGKCCPENACAIRENRTARAIPGAFDRLGAALLIPGRYDVLLMDELGVLEKDAPAFRKAVLDALHGEIPVYGVIKPKRSAFLDEIRSCPSVQLIELHAEDRESAWERLLTLAGEESRT